MTHIPELFNAVLCWIEAHQGLAAWMQAFFSIFAIGISIWLFWAQQQHERRKEISDNLCRIDSVLTFAKLAQRYIEEHLNAWQSEEAHKKFSDSYDEEKYERLRVILTSFPLNEIASVNLTGEFIEITAIYQRFHKDAKNRGNIYFSLQVQHGTQEYFRKFVDQLNPVTEKIENAKAKYSK